MVQQSDFPEEWSCTSPDKRVRVEVRVPERSFDTFGGEVTTQNLTYSWIEIPTSSFEMWVEKGDAADIQRTARVEFPSEWGVDDETVRHNSPRQLVNTSTQDPNEFTFARVWLQAENGEWYLEHLGWIGGVGPSGQEGVSKFWVYDFAELLSSVPIGVTFNQPTVREALEEIARLTNDNTYIPLGDVQWIPPEGEELTGNVDRVDPEDVDPSQRDVDVAQATNVLGGDYHVYETMNSSNGPVTTTDIFTALPIAADAGTTYDASGVIDTGQGDAQGYFEGAGGELIDGDVGGAIGALGTEDETQTQKFVENHSTLNDVYEWLGLKIDGNLHFEPELDSVTLIADVSTSRRVFVHDAVMEDEDAIDAITDQLFATDFIEEFLGIELSDVPYTWHDTVSVIRNDALFEMKPINTLRLRGATSKSVLVEDEQGNVEQAQLGDYGMVEYSGVSRSFPAITVQVPSLLEAANGVELAPEVVESDIGELDEAENEARKELSNRLEETSEGEIVLEGEPKIMPYDRVDAFEVCNGFVEYEQIPVSYEVESVKHEKMSDDTYKTIVDVSVWANDKTIETTEKRMIEV